MPQLEPFCSAKLFPLQPQDVPTKEGIFQRIIFFPWHLRFYEFRKLKVEDLNYEKELYLFIHIYILEGSESGFWIPLHVYQE